MIWNGFKINCKDNNELIEHLNFLEFTISKLKKELNEDIILKNVQNFKEFMYDSGKISIIDNKLITSKNGLNLLPEKLKNIFCEKYKNFYYSNYIQTNDMFYLKMKYDEYIIDNIFENDTIVVEKMIL